MPKTLSALIRETRSLLDFTHEASDHATIVQEVESGVEFRGANLWILIFAIFIASIGLNVNSTAIVIGAMLISPLMGPILGLAVGVGIYDFDLIRRSLKNLSFAAGASIIASTVYFFITPLAGPQSELLARTSPTLWDVFVAFFGGLAGMIAATRRVKGNVVPGVAIATAIMPPLCTAGYGIATGNLAYVVGALYLFFINGVFICVGSFLIIRLLRFPPKTFVDAETQLRVRRYVFLTAALTAIPSVFLAVQIVKKSFFESDVNRFIEAELVSASSQVIGKKLYFDAKPRRIELSMIGEVPDETQQEAVRRRLKEYGLKGVVLRINGLSGGKEKDFVALKASLLGDLYHSNAEALKDKDEKIHLLEEEIVRLKSRIVPASDIEQEMRALNSKVESVALAVALSDEAKPPVSEAPVAGGATPKNVEPERLLLVLVQFKGSLSAVERKHLERWLSVRTKISKISVNYSH